FNQAKAGPNSIWCCMSSPARNRGTGGDERGRRERLGASLPPAERPRRLARRGKQSDIRRGGRKWVHQDISVTRRAPSRRTTQEARRSSLSHRGRRPAIRRRPTTVGVHQALLWTRLVLRM